MPWWKLRRTEQPPPAGGRRAEPGPREGGAAPLIRDAERRSLRRLLQRRADLEYDLARAESARHAENEWTERIGQLDAAIAQAQADLAAVRPRPRTGPPLALPPASIAVVDVRPAEPATVVLRAGGVTLRYREELDWAERGHQLALPRLAREAGDVDALVPLDLPAEDRERFADHLRHSFAIIADEVLERTIDGGPLPGWTLADVSRPCADCGGWLDPKGRCPACVELDWQRQQIRSDADRLRHERDDVRRDLEQARERLPIVERQLAETEADIRELEDKGVEPE